MSELEIAKKALVRIAADHETTPTGHRKKISRDRMILVAREACHQLGWEYGFTDHPLLTKGK